MSMKNRYPRRARISERRFRRLVRLFALDLNATQIAELSDLNRNTVNQYLRGIHKRIAAFCEVSVPFAVDVHSAWRVQFNFSRQQRNLPVRQYRIHIGFLATIMSLGLAPDQLSE